MNRKLVKTLSFQKLSHSGSWQLLGCSYGFAYLAQMELKNFRVEEFKYLWNPVLDGLCTQTLMLPRGKAGGWQTSPEPGKARYVLRVDGGLKDYDALLNHQPKYTLVPFFFSFLLSWLNMSGIKQLFRILGIYQKEQMVPVVWAVSCHSSMSWDKWFMGMSHPWHLSHWISKDSMDLHWDDLAF